MKPSRPVTSGGVRGHTVRVHEEDRQGRPREGTAAALPTRYGRMAYPLPSTFRSATGTTTSALNPGRTGAATVAASELLKGIVSHDHPKVTEAQRVSAEVEHQTKEKST